MGRIRRVGVRRFLVGGVAVFVLVAASAAPAAASGWKVQPTPNPPAQDGSGLDGVSCSSGSACTAVGFSVTDNVHLFLTLAERWDGTGWKIQPTPNPVSARGGENYLVAVSCSSGSACTAVGNYLTANGNKTLTLAERWNGTSWKIQQTNHAGVLDGVSCSSASACSAVGNIQTTATTTRPLAERWNGHRWKPQPTPKPTGARGNDSLLTGVSCSSGSACTTVGYAGNLFQVPVTLAERWDGTSWKIQPTPNPVSAQGNALNGVSCSSASACTAVGSAGLGTLAERWNGTRWSLQPTPKLPTPEFDGVSCWSGSACTAVGSYFNGKDLTLAERWNGG